MTKLDLHSYGHKQLGDGGAGAEAAVDESFFGFTTGKTAPAESAGWDSLDGDIDSLLPGAQAAPTVAVATARAAARPGAVEAAARPRPAAGPRQASGPQARTMVEAAPRPAAMPARRPAPEPEEEAAPAPQRLSFAPPAHARSEEPASMAATALPLCVLLAGGATAAWFFGSQQDYVMAGITTALTVIATTFVRVLLRR
jgi:hypothetical protein